MERDEAKLCRKRKEESGGRQESFRELRGDVARARGGLAVSWMGNEEHVARGVNSPPQQLNFRPHAGPEERGVMLSLGVSARDGR